MYKILIVHLIHELRCETSRMTKEIHKSNSDNTVHVQDQIRLLACSYLFNFKCVIQQWSSREIFSHKILKKKKKKIIKKVYEIFCLNLKITLMIMTRISGLLMLLTR